MKAHPVKIVAGTPFMNWLVAGIIMGLQIGCRTTNYNRQPKPATVHYIETKELELTSTSPTTKVTLHQLVTVEKNEPLMPSGRWWDEYTLTIANQGPSVLVIDSAILFDFEDQSRLWDADRAKLVECSWEHWQAYKKAGTPVVPDIPQMAGLKFILLAPIAAELSAGSLCPYGFVLTPVFYGAAIKETVKLRREFTKRQLKLPLRLASGQSAKGSLSFPMTPGPLRLVLHGQNDGQSLEIVIPLTGLSNIHLPAKPAAPASPSSTADQSSS